MALRDVRRAGHVTRIKALLAEISTQMRRASRLVIAVIRVFYDFFMVACLIAAALVIIGGRPRQAFVWGGTGAASALGWMAAKLAIRAARVLREEWDHGDDGNDGDGDDGDDSRADGRRGP